VIAMKSVNHWDDIRTIDEVNAALSGPAVRFATKEILNMESLEELERRFYRYFRAEPVQNIRIKLNNMSQGKDEEAYAFGKRLQALQQKNSTEDISDAELSEYFIRGLHSKLKFEVAKIIPRPKAFDELLLQASALESAFEYMKPQGQNTKNVAPITPAFESKFEAMVEGLSELLRRGQRGTPTFCRGRCYICQKEDHLMRNCPLQPGNTKKNTEKRQGEQMEHAAVANDSSGLMLDDKEQEETKATCLYPGCTKLAGINPRTGKQGRFCSKEHREAMIKAKIAVEARKKKEAASVSILEAIQEELSRQGNEQTPSDLSQLKEDDEFLMP